MYNSLAGVNVVRLTANNVCCLFAFCSVLDVKGLVKGKKAADDLYNHKVTYPVAALFTIDHPDRAAWFECWQSHDVPAMVRILNESGTMERCERDIERYVEDGWQQVDESTPTSFSKVLLKMFGHFLVEQHY